LHKESVVKETLELKERLKSMSLQLYTQSALIGELAYNVLNEANMYYSFRFPKELGEYHWIIDAKDRNRVTPWEDWWSTLIAAMVESKSFRKPMIGAEDGNYKWHDRFRTELSEYKRQFVNDPDKGDFVNSRLVMKEDFRFSSDAEFGLEAADILVNAVRRSLAGNFERSGWLPITSLMINFVDPCIRLLSFSNEGKVPGNVPYANVLADFEKGGRVMLPESMLND